MRSYQTFYLWCNNKEEHELRELCNCYNIDREDYLHDMELIVKARNCILNEKEWDDE